MDKIIDCFANKLVNYFTNHKYVDESQRSVYLYGAVVAIQSAVNVMFTLIIGYVFGLFIENLCFFIVFRVLRKYSGGFHSEKYFICLSTSIVLNIIFLISFKLFKLYPNFLLIFLIELFSSLIVILFSPVTNKNKGISNKEFKIYKLIVSIVCIVTILLSVILVIKSNFFVYSIGMAIVLDSILVLLGKFKVLEFGE